MEYSFYIPLTCPTGILSRKGRGQTARPSLLPVRRARRARGEVKQLENDTFIKRRVGTRPTNRLSCRKVFVRHLCKTTRSRIKSGMTFVLLFEMTFYLHNKTPARKSGGFF